MRLSLNAPTRLVLFACLYLFFLVITSLIVSFLVSRHPDSTAMMRIASVLQDILLFILPALITAMLVTRLPAQFLQIDNKPSIRVVIYGLAVLIFSIPAMNHLISANASMHLPESLASVEEWMRRSEDSALKAMELVMGQHSIMSLVMNILIMGIFAALSEELFYRGALQRLLGTSKLNRHVAVWLTAIIFSAMHMQFFGFFPRMLLGVFFGYAVLWSGSLWVPVILHAANNSLFLISNYIYSDNHPGEAVGDYQSNLPVEVAGMVIAVFFLYLMYRSTRKGAKC